MDMRLIIINQATIAGVSGSPSVRASGDTVSVRPDSGTENQVNINKRQDRAQLDTLEQTPLVDRSSISPAPVQSILASSANQNQRGNNTFQTGALQEQASREVPQKNLVTAGISESALRASSPSSVRSDEFQTCDELSDDSDENTSLLELETQILGRYQEAPAPVSTQQASTLVVQAAASLDDPSAPEFSHIYHEILSNIHKRLCKAYGEGIQLAFRKVETNPGAQPIVGGSSVSSPSGASNDSAVAGVEKSHPSGKASKRLRDRLIKAAGLTAEEILKKPEDLNKLAVNLTEIIQDELEKTQLWQSRVSDGVGEYVVELEGDDVWVNGFTRSISTILIHLTHQVFLDKVAWVDTGAGKKKASEIIASLIASVLNLSDHPSAQTNAKGVLNEGVVTVAQSGNKLFNEKMKAVRADSLRKIINQALISMMAEGIELTDENFDELLSRVKAITINTLMDIRSDIVRIFSKWSEKKSDEINSIQSRVVNSVAKTLTGIVKEQGGVKAKVSAFVDTASNIAGKFTGGFTKLFKSKPEPKPESKPNESDEERIKFTEQKIRNLINGEIKNVVQLFESEQEFKGQLEELIDKNLGEIVPVIKENLLKLKKETKVCKESGGGIQDLVSRVTTIFGGGSQQPESVDVLQGAVAASSTLITPGTSAALASSDQPDHRTSSSPSSEVMTEACAEQTRVIDQVIAQESSKMVDEAVGLLIGELRKNLDTVMEKVKPGIGNVMEKAISKSAAFIARRNEEDTAGLELPETIPGFTAAMTPVFTKLVVDIFSSKLESDEWERTTRTKVHEAVGKSNPPADPQRPSESAKFFDETLKTAEADALRQVADPLKSALDKLPFPSLQKLSSDFILQSTRDGTVWLDDLVRDVFNKKIDDETIVLTIIDTVSEEVVKLQHQLVIGAINWLKQRAKDWATKSQVDHCMNWLGKWITDNKEQIDQDAKAYVKALLNEVAPELEEAIHKRLKALRSAIENSRSDVTTTFQRIVEELEPEAKPGDTATRGDKKKKKAEKTAPNPHVQTLSKALAAQAGKATGEAIDLFIKESGRLETVKPIVSTSLREVMTVAVEQGVVFTARRNGDRVDTVDAVTGGRVLAGQLPETLTTAVVELLSEKLLSAEWKKDTVADVTKAAGQALAPTDKDKAKTGNEAGASAEGEPGEQSAAQPADTRTTIAREVDQMLGDSLAEMITAVADQVESLLKAHPYPSAAALLDELARQGIDKSADWVVALVNALFDDADVIPGVIDALTGQAEQLVQTLVTRGLGWLGKKEEGTGELKNRQRVESILVNQAEALLDPVLTCASGQGGALGKQTPEAITALSNVVRPFVKDQVKKGQVLERLAHNGVNELVHSVDRHKDDLAKDVKTQTRETMNKAVPELKSVLQTRLATLRSAMTREPGDQAGLVAGLRQAAKTQKPEAQPGDTATRGDKKKKKAEKTAPNPRVQALSKALAAQAGEATGEAIDLFIKESGRLETVKPIVSTSLREVMTVAVEQGVVFTARRNGDRVDTVDAVTGGRVLAGQLPETLTTAVVELLSEKLLSAEWKKDTVADVTKAAGQALAPTDKDKAKTGNEAGASAEGEPGEQSAAQPADTRTTIAREVDQMLGDSLAEMITAVADQVESLLKAHPYPSAAALLDELARQGIDKSTDWVVALVNGLFDDADVIPGVIDALTGQAEQLVQTLVTRGLGWLGKKEEGTGELKNRQRVESILVNQAEALLDPVLTCASGQGGALGKQTPEAITALSNVVRPFVKDQVKKGQVLERLARSGVDELVTSVNRHKGDLAADVKTKTRASLEKAVPELEQLLHRRLQALVASMNQGHGSDLVTDLRAASTAQKPEVQPGDAAIGGDKKKKKAEKTAPNPRVQALSKALAAQAGEATGEAIDLFIKESGRLETVKPIVSTSLREVMTVAVEQGVVFTARRNGDRVDTVDAVTGGRVLAGQLPETLTTAVVELLSEKLLSAEWKKDTVADVTKAAGQALAPTDKDKAKTGNEAGASAEGEPGEQSAAQPADTRTTIAREVDRMVGEGLAEMVTVVADRVESLLKEHPYPSAAALLDELARQGIDKSVAWVDALVKGLFAGDAEAIPRAIPRVIRALSDQTELLVQTLVGKGLDWLGKKNEKTGELNRKAVEGILVNQAEALLDPVLTCASGQAGALVKQTPKAITALGDAVRPFVKDQVKKGQVLERLARNGVDELVTSVDRHKDDLAADVKTKTRASLEKAVPELEQLLHRRLQALVTSMNQGHGSDLVTDLRAASTAQKPEVQPGDAAIGGDKKKKKAEKTAPNPRVQALSKALAAQAGEATGEAIDLFIKESGRLETVKPIVSTSLREVMTVAVEQGVVFTARRNGDRVDTVDAVTGGRVLAGQLPETLTTAVVELLSEKLLSAEWKKDTVADVTKAAGQALAPTDKDKAKTGNEAGASAEGEPGEQSAAQPADTRTTIAREVDQMLGDSLAEMITAVADQVESLLKAHPYPSAAALLDELARQGIDKSADWVVALVNGLFDDADVIPGVIDALTGQAEQLVQTLVTRGLGWLGKKEEGTGELTNRQRVESILVNQAEALLDPVLTCASGQAGALVKQTPEAITALGDAVRPFVKDQVKKGQVLERLARNGVDELVTSVDRHKDDLAADVKTKTRASLEKAVPELEQLLHRRLQALVASMNQGHGSDLVTDLRAASTAQKPEVQPGDAAIGGDKKKKKAEKTAPNPHVQTLSKALAAQAGKATGEVIDLFIEQSGRLETVKPIVSDSLREVMRVAVEQGVVFTARRNGDPVDTVDAVAGGTALAGPLPETLTTAVVELLSEKLLSAEWRQDTIADVTKTAGQALVPADKDKAKASGSAAQPADTRTTIAREVDRMVGEGLAEMVTVVADRVESLLKAHPYPSAAALLDELARQGIEKSVAWVDALVKGLFAGDAEAIPRVIRALSDQTELLVQTLVGKGLDWLGKKNEKTGELNRKAVEGILVNQAEALLDPVLTCASGQAGALVKQTPEAITALGDAVRPFVKDQVKKGQVLERLARSGVDELVTSVNRHKGDLAADVKTKTRASLEKAVPELEQLLHRRLQALVASMNQGHGSDLVTDLRAASTAQKPEVQPGDAAIGGDKKKKKAEKTAPNPHVQTLSKALAAQAGKATGEVIDLFIEQSGRLETVKPIVSDSLREVMRVAVEQGVVFTARRNGDPVDTVDAVAGGTALAGPLPETLTTAVVELLSEKLLSAEWRQDTIADVTKTAGQALVPADKDKAKASGSAAQPADTRTTIAREVDRMVGEGLAEMVTVVADRVESLLKAHPYPSAAALLDELARQGIDKSVAWVDALVKGLFAGDAEAIPRAIPRVIRALSDQTELLVQTLVGKGLDWLGKKNEKTGELNRKAVEGILVNQAEALLDPVLTCASGQAGALVKQTPKAITALGDAVRPFVKDQVKKGQVLERLARNGVDELVTSVDRHKDDLAADVKTKTRASLEKAVPELEQLLHRRLQALVTSMNQGHGSDLVTDLRAASTAQKPEVQPGDAAIGGDKKKKKAEKTAPNPRVQALSKALAAQAGEATGEAIDLFIKESGRLETVKPIVSTSLREVMTVAVEQGVVFTARRNGDRVDTVDAVTGGRVLAGQLPETLTTAVVELLSEKLLSAEWKKDTVADVTKAAGQALAPTDKDKAKTGNEAGASAEGEPGEQSAAQPADTRTTIAREVDQMLGDSLAEMITAVADQVESLLKAHPYPSAAALLDELARQGIDKSADWVVALVNGLFDDADVIPGVIDALTGQAEQLVQTLVTRGLGWLGKKEEGTGELTNRQRVESILVNQAEALLDPVLTCASGQAGALVKQTPEAITALGDAVRPFVKDQVKKGQVLERLARNGVDELVTSVNRHKGDLAADVKTKTRASLEKAVPELEQLLHRRLQALVASMNQGHGSDLVTDLRAASTAQKPEVQPGDAAIGGDKKKKKAEKTAPNPHVQTLSKALAAQAGKATGEVIDLFIEQSGRLETVKPIVSDSLREVMRVAVEQGVVFTARRNGDPVDTVDAVAGGTALAGPLPETLTTAVVELLSEKLLSAEWRQDTIADVTKTAGQALVPADKDKAKASGSAAQPADTRTTIAREVDRMVGEGLAEMVTVVADRVESLLKAHPYPSAAALLDELARQGIDKSVAWVDALVKGLFAGDAEAIPRAIPRVIRALSDQTELLVQTLVGKGLDWLGKKNEKTGELNRKAVEGILVNQAEALLDPVLTCASGQAGALVKQTPKAITALGDAVRPFVKDQVKKGQVLERLARNGVDELVTSVDRHKDDLAADVKTKTRASLEKAVPELEQLLHRRLQALVTSMNQGHGSDLVTDLRAASTAQKPEVQPGDAAIGGDKKKKKAEKTAPNPRVQALSKALAAQAGEATGEAIDLFIKESGRLETVKPIVSTSLREVMTVAVEQGVVFTARRNGDRVDTVDAVTGGRVLAGQLPETLTTAVVELLSEKLLSAEWKKDTVADVTKAAGQALAPTDKDKAKTGNEAGASAEGEPGEQSAAQPADTRTTIAREVDQMLGDSLAEMITAVADQVESLLKAHPYPSAAALLDELARQGIDKSADWVVALVNGLFDDADVIPGVIDALTGQAEQLVQTLVTRGLGWLGKKEEGTGELTNRQRVESILVNQAEALLDPVLTCASGQAGALVKQTPEAITALGDAVRPFVKDQVKKGQVLERLARNGVDELVTSVDRHKDDLAADVKTKTRASLEKAVPELEQLLHRRLQALVTSMNQGHGSDLVTDLRAASTAQKPEVQPGDAAIGGDKKKKKAEKTAPNPRVQALSKALAAQAGEATGEAIDLFIKESGRLETVKPIVSTSLREVMTVAVEQGVVFTARRNGDRVDTVDAVTGGRVLAGQLPETLTTAVVELLSEKLLSAEWKKDTVADVTKAAGQALAPTDKDKAKASGSAAQPADTRTTIAREVDRMVGEGLAEMVTVVADRVESLLKEHPYPSAAALLDELARQGIDKSVAWVDALVKGLFAGDAEAIPRVIRALSDQTELLVQTLVGKGLDWLGKKNEKTGELNRKAVEGILVNQAEALLDPVLTCASGQAGALVKQTPEAITALGDAVRPFVKDQVKKGQVLERLARNGVDELVTSVDRHKDDLAADVKTKTRASLEKAVPELEQLLHRRLQALVASMNQGHGSDLVTDLRAASTAQKPEVQPGDAAIGGDKKTTVASNYQQDHWADARKAFVEQLGHGVGDVIELTKQESPDLVAARSLLTEHIGEVMEVAVKESAEFIAKHNGVRYGSSLVNGVVLPNGPVHKLTGVISPFLTKTVVESLSEKFLSATWKKQTVCEVKKVTEKALFPERQDKVSSVTSKESQQTVKRKAFGQPTVIGSEADEILKKGLAEMLRDGANQLEAVLKSLPYDCVKEMASDLTLQGIADGTKWLYALAAGLFADNEVVVTRVINAITEQAVATQQAVIDGVLGWLSTENIKTKQKPNRQKLLDILVHRVGALVEPAVTGASSLVAESLMRTSESRALRDAVLPFLQGQLNRGQVLERLAGYSVDQLSDWISQHREVISKDVEVNVRAMMQKVAPELESILHNRLAMLRSTVQQSLQNKSDVVANLRRAAEEIAPCQAMSAATKQNSKPEQSKATGVLPSLIPALSKGITAVITNGTDIIRRKVWTDNLPLKLGRYEDCSKMSIFPIVIPQVQRIVNEAIIVGSDYGIRQLTEPSDGNPVRITEAVKKHFQELTAGYLGHMVADAIEGMADAVNKNAGDIQKSIEKALKSSGPSTDLQVLLTPHIHGAIDQILHEGRSFIQERISKWIEANASEATPELHKAIDKILTHIMANGGEWITRHQNGIELEVIKPIQLEITETLKEAQAEIIQNVAVWLSNEANLNRLVATFTNEIRETVTNVVVATVAKQVSGKESGPEFQRVVDGITSYVAPIIDQALRQAITYTVKSLSGWVQQHGTDISSLVNPLIDKTVQDVMPSVRQAVQDKALLLARNKAQDIDFNKLAAELAVAFVDHIDPDTLTSGALKVEPKSSVVRELPKILCFLMQTAETYECLGGNLMEPIKIDRVEIDGRVFKDIKAQLIRMADGSIRIRKMDLKFEDVDKIDIDIEIAGISISYQLPEKIKLYRAALLSSAPMMRPADLARSLFDAFVPERIDFNIDQITGEFHDDILDGPGEDTLGFGLSDIKLSLRLHKYYPKPYMDISVGPKDGHKTIESIKVKVAGQGVVDHIEADINVDRHRNGFADVSVLVEPGRLNRFAGWLIGGPIKVEAKAAINNGIGTLDDIESIHVRAPRFGGICNALIKNTIKAFNPGFSLGDDGKPVIKLKLTLFSEERSNPITRWLAKAANRILQFFTKPIEIRLSFKGAPYVPPEKGEKGVGSFNGIRFIDGLFNPCPLSIQSDTHEKLLRKLREISIDKNPQEHLECLREAISQVIEDFRLGNAPSDLSLVREIPLESLVLLVDYVKHNEGRQEDLARLLFLVASLVEALPEKAVELVNSSGFTPEADGQPYLLHLISSTPQNSWLANPKDGTVMERVYQDHQFKRLKECWMYSQSNPDGSIYRPGCAKEPVQEFTEKAVEKVRTLTREISIPDDIRLMMARDFDFAGKVFGIEPSGKQGLMVSSPVNQIPYYSQGVQPVRRIKDMGWTKHRFNVPGGIELSGGSTAPVA